MMRIQVTSFVLGIVLAAACGRADSIETQNNPVPNGTIQVMEGDPDRGDWDGIPWFETDEDFDDFYPIDIDRVQVAHDNENLYFHVSALIWDVEETWRIGIYVDTDEDNFTGYNGNFLAVGADYFVEAGNSFEFTAATQADWLWESTADLARDQTEWTDFEVAVPRSAIGDPSLINFLLFANNGCCDFGLPDDVYPNGAAALEGEYFTYELGAVSVVGDFNGNGFLDLPDLDDLTATVASGVSVPGYDLNDDGLNNVEDIRVWVKDLYGSWMGDANLDGEFNSGDLVRVLAAGTYEADQDSVWSTGDFNGDGRTNTGDLVEALGDGGYELGPRPAVATVPEPGSLLLACAGGLSILYRRRSR